MLHTVSPEAILSSLDLSLDWSRKDGEAKSAPQEQLPELQVQVGDSVMFSVTL